MIKVFCSVCNKELDKPGALIFSPPEENYNLVAKHHLCEECYEEVCQCLSDMHISKTGGHDQFDYYEQENNDPEIVYFEPKPSQTITPILDYMEKIS